MWNNRLNLIVPSAKLKFLSDKKFVPSANQPSIIETYLKIIGMSANARCYAKRPQSRIERRNDELVELDHPRDLSGGWWAVRTGADSMASDHGVG